MSTRANQVMVTVAATVAALGMLIGYGAFGRRVKEGFGGAFRPNSTLLTPAGPAFWIWLPIYVALCGFLVWQWVGDHASRPRIRAASVPIALTLALNGGWLLVVQANQVVPTGIWLSVAMIVALELSLVGVLRRLQVAEPADRLEAVVVDGTFGVFFGWITIAAIANVAAALASQGVRPESDAAQLVAVIVLSLAALLGVGFSLRLGPRLAVAGGLTWGLVWIGIGRFTSELTSPLVGASALAAAAVVLLAAVWLRRTQRRQDGRTQPTGLGTVS